MSLSANSPKTTPCESAPEALLSFRQAARILQVDRAFVTRLVGERELPVIPVGTRLRIPRWALLRYEKRKVREQEAEVLALLSTVRRRVA